MTSEATASAGQTSAEATPHGATASRATLQGLVAVLLWSSLATITTGLGDIPPFQLASLSFAIAALIGLVYARLTGTPLAVLRAVPTGFWLLATGGLLGYHVAYFYAFKHAPAVEVNLVNYMWPLLIVLLSAVLPARFGGGRLAWWHVLGAALAGAGSALVVVAGSGTPGDLASAAAASNRAGGLAAAALAAVVWAGYSVASRLYAHVPSLAIMGACALTAVGAGLGHLAFETTTWPLGAAQWAGVVAQGLGPVGLAFYLWDAGMKHGAVRLLGAASNLTPVLSTVLLALAGRAELSWRLVVAAGLVAAGATLAGRASRPSVD